MKVDRDFLKEFEENIDPAKPEKSKFPINILGYGEISVVFEIEEYEGVALKRIPNFTSEEQVRKYIELYYEYLSLLRNAGINVPESGAEYVVTGDNRIVLFIFQEKLDPRSICNKVIHRIPDEEVAKLFRRILDELAKVWNFNKHSEIEIGIDGQISNWALTGDLDSKLLYFDTSTPMVRKDGEHQIDTEVFLKASPPILRTVVKKLFLQEVLDRYFDFHLVTVDLIANLFKEKRADVIPMLIDTANEYFKDYDVAPINYEEVKKYYKNDAFIWSLFLNLRKIHRSMVRLAGGRYEYFLPEKIER
jgi:hypothetical protein